MAELREHEARRRTKLGTVVSDKMHQTVVVAVESVSRHRIYGRNVRRTERFKAHDERNECSVGDQVIIAESRPISKEKHWVVRQIVRETIGPGLEVLAEEPTLASTPVEPSLGEPSLDETLDDDDGDRS